MKAEWRRYKVLFFSGVAAAEPDRLDEKEKENLRPLQFQADFAPVSANQDGKRESEL